MTARRTRGRSRAPWVACGAGLVAPWAALAVRGEGLLAGAAGLVDAAVAGSVVLVAVRGSELAGAPLWLLVAMAASVLCAAGVRLASAWAGASEAAWRRRCRGERSGVWPALVVGVPVAVALVGVAGLACVAAWTALRLDAVFASHEPVVARPEAAAGGGAVAGSATTSARSGAGGDAPWVGRVNVLVVGTDAGFGRSGARTDSMNLVSLDPATGDAFVVGLPRNLQHAPMPQSAKAWFPDGFDDLLNAVWEWAAEHPEAAPDPAAPSESMLKAVVANITGLEVHYLVVTDMAGLAEVVDAVGGVTVRNLVEAPLTPLEGGGRQLPPSLGVGEQTLDGQLALAYARSRKADSDYERMARQRCVLDAVARKVAGPALAGSWGSLVDSLAGAVRTDMPRSRLADLAGVARRVSPSAVRVVALVPPQVDTSDPDWAAVRFLVAGAQAAGAAAGAPPAGPAGDTGGAAASSSDAGSPAGVTVSDGGDSVRWGAQVGGSAVVESGDNSVEGNSAGGGSVGDGAGTASAVCEAVG